MTSDPSFGLAEGRVVSIAIQRRWEDVYAFASDPERMAQWARGLGETLRKEGEDWVAQTPLGPARVRFTAPNPFGVLDHEVTLPDGTVVSVPLRVVANGAGCDVQLTLFRMPGMSDEAFERDHRAVRRDLAALKALMEG